MDKTHSSHDTLGDEQRLAAALGALVQQIDISEYRDALGHDLKRNTAFRHAQRIVEDFGVTHEDICRVLDSCEDDLPKAAGELAAIGERAHRVASPDDTPIEYLPWRSGP